MLPLRYMIRAIRILLKTLAVMIAGCVSLAMLLYYIIVAVNCRVVSVANIFCATSCCSYRA